VVIGFRAYFSAFISPARSSTQRKQNRTTYETSAHSGQAHPPQHTQDSTTGNVLGSNMPSNNLMN